MRRNRVVVVGSTNMDLVTSVPRPPAPGETILGTAFTTTQGGKGANQAIAAAKAGADVTFVGAVGDDTFALDLRQALVDAEVDADLLRELPGASGIAAITVDDAGGNAIVVVPGANAQLTTLTDADLQAIANADVLLCQLEIPLDTVVAAARHAATHDTVVMLNPSPVRPLPAALLGAVDVLVVNETEADQLGRDVLAAVPHVVTTLGADGVRYRAHQRLQSIPSPTVDVVETTGAGDAFAGVLACEWGAEPLAALIFACAAGALATTRRGASVSSPTRAEIEALVAAQP